MLGICVKAVRLVNGAFLKFQPMQCIWAESDENKISTSPNTVETKIKREKKAYCGRVATRRITCTPQHLTCHMASGHARNSVLPYLDHPSSPCGNNLLYQNTTLLIKMHWSKQRYASSTVIFALFWPSTFKLWTRTLQELKRWLLEYCLKRHFLDHFFTRRCRCFLPTRPCAFFFYHSLQKFDTTPPKTLWKNHRFKQETGNSKKLMDLKDFPFGVVGFLRFFGAGFQLFLVGSHLGLSCPGHTPCYTASSSEPQ